MGKKVKIYALTTCSHCKAAKKFLNDHNIEFETTDVDILKDEARTAALDEVIQYNPERSFPTIIIGEKIIIGFRENDIREALGI
ncbi:MAG: glutaredoxin family protein [Smithellaceae bacterium]|jgi:glutaredoxin|nr:glutaredoxin family protein [Syntrophaceae bacterium]HOE78877.1 glutaredoxin family protein [Smithellaceae bacterium]HPL97036.1 glutaredoxin family protein [Smithellaceae bacterium]HQF83575.1 glutaredoxin family protein [Smithellaceae bacterium]HQG79559.1 glutaredoxin family protein [Smithellaceae bacterium]